MSNFFKSISSLEKCFIDESYESKKEEKSGRCLRGEEFAFEVVYTGDNMAQYPRCTFTLEVISPLKDHITVRDIESVPVRYACPPGDDENYLRKTPGLYPDLLAPIDPLGRIFLTPGMLKSLYVQADVPADFPAGDCPITLRFTAGEEVHEVTYTLHIIDAVLPKQETIVTEWFHTDCIADYYELETFSEKHWEYISKFMKTAVKNGINAILTPVFTPPLDTAVGGERRTTQLVDVAQTADENGNIVWHFAFDKLDRWIETALANGVEYFEISHLYTQWGAGHAPKIMGRDENGEYRKFFGWETDSLSDEYRTFLRAFLTAFLDKMKGMGLDKKCLFHISDEPGYDHLEIYAKARGQIADLLEGYVVMDALSNFDLYRMGAVANPIPSNDHIEPFLEANIPNLWTYYCCGQWYKVSNRLLAMPMARTRVIGMQMWKYNIAGFLQWGYNFYNSCHSVRHIDPYLITDGDYWVPAGDCFSVYPGENGEALETMHLKGFTMALSDIRAMKLAEKLCGRDAVLAALEENCTVTFKEYPADAEWLLGVREKINDLIENNI